MQEEPEEGEGCSKSMKNFYFLEGGSSRRGLKPLFKGTEREK